MSEKRSDDGTLLPYHVTNQPPPFSVLEKKLVQLRGGERLTAEQKAWFPAMAQEWKEAYYARLTLFTEEIYSK